MGESSTSDKRVRAFEPLPEPRQGLGERPLTEAAAARAHDEREALQRAVHGRSTRRQDVCGLHVGQWGRALGVARRSIGIELSRADLAYGCVKLEDAGIGGRRILVDCSHGNSEKDFRKQADVFRHVLKMAEQQEPSLLGAMLESNLVEGSQKRGTALQYGCSITDACIGWEETEARLREAYRVCGASMR